MSKIQKLRNSIETKCVSEDYEQVNKCINEIISDKREGDDIKEIKSLICHLDGKSNKSKFYSVIAIAYALFIGAISFIANCITKERMVYFFLLTLFMVIAVTLLSVGILRNDYKDAFILRALNFKLEELNNKNLKK